MAKKSQFLLLKSLAEKELDDALKDLGLARQNYLAGEKKLRDLIEYKDGYGLQLSQMLKEGITTSTWENFERFINSMDKAILQQRRYIADLDEKVKLAIECWQEKRKKMNSFEILVNREIEANLKKELKQEQKIMDEYSARASRRKS